MKSMTGFGISKYASDELELEVSVKTVNGRYFEVKFHSPKEFAPFEGELKAQVGQLIKRGTTDVYIARRYSEKGKKISIATQDRVAEKWLKTYSNLSKKLGLKSSSVSRLDVLERLPEVLKVDERPILGAKIKKVLSDNITKAASACDKERAREGASIKKELLSLLNHLGAQVKTMEEMKVQAGLKTEERLHTRLKKLGLKGEVEPQRFAQELVILLDKLDVLEELIRLKEHIKSCKKLITLKGPQGKKIDFYCQELLREVNTIGSKSQIAKLTEVVVNAKSIIERFREQVQNIE